MVNGSLPHGNIICAVHYEPHGEATKDEEHEEEAWKRRKKKSKQAMDQLKLALTPAIAGLNTGYSRPGQVNAPLALKPSL
jgi:hypothetical protein